MTALILWCLCAAALVVHAGWRDHRIRTARSHQVEIDRLLAELPPPLPLDWPMALSPLDLPGIGHTEELAAVELSPRVFMPAPAPLVVGLAVVEGRHHVGVAPGTEQQRARWDSPTGRFLTLVAAGWSEEERLTLSREWWCESCLDDHRDCAGVCACPCTLVESLAVAA